MTGKEKFWTEYDRLPDTTSLKYNRMIANGESGRAGREVGNIEADLRRKAMSSKWVAYDLLQASYEVIINPVERIKKLSTLEYLNEHDAYLMNKSFVDSDYKFIMKKWDECKADYDLCMKNQQELRNSERLNDHDRVKDYIELFYACCDLYNDRVKILKNAETPLRKSILDQKECKRFAMEMDDNGKNHMYIYRYKNESKNELLYKVEIPILSMAEEIMANMSLKTKLTSSEISECANFIKRPMLP